MSGLRIFQNREFGAVRVVEYGGEPWFVARDVCAVLGTETRDLPDILEHDEQRPIVDIIHTLNDSTGLRRDSRIISEPGLYSLVLRSRKPEAKAFKRWIVHEVIPSIRRTGGYGALALPNFRNPAEAARAWAVGPYPCTPWRTKGTSLSAAALRRWTAFWARAWCPEPHCSWAGSRA